MGLYLLSCLSTQLDLQVFKIPISLVRAPASLSLKPNYWVYKLYLLIKPFDQIPEKTARESSQIMHMTQIWFQNIAIVSVNESVVTVFERF